MSTILTTDENGQTRVPLRPSITLGGYVAEKVRRLLAVNEGDYFLNIRYGIPYWDKLFGQKSTNAYISNIFRKKLAEIPEVKSIDNVAITQVRGTVKYSATLNLIDDTSINIEDII